MNYAWKSQAEDLPSNLWKIGSTLSDWVAIIQSMHNVDKKKIQFVNLQPIFTSFVFELFGKVRREVEDELFSIYVTSPESATEIRSWSPEKHHSKLTFL